ncbi:MAG: nucleotidyl transferase AbiEii/AbiGii toxin family protein [Phycisphaeraceae bacterium]
MDDLIRWLCHTLTCLNEVGARCALIGGMAVSARTEPRFTRDVDLAVAVASDTEAERVLAYLIRSGYRPMMELDQDVAQRLATMRLLPPGVRVNYDESDEPLLVDLLFASCGIEPEVVAAARELEIAPGLVVPVACVPHLLAMKALSVSDKRPLDMADMQALAKVASSEDIKLAKRLVKLIHERGYGRDRDLQAKLQEALRFR